MRRRIFILLSLAFVSGLVYTQNPTYRSVSAQISSMTVNLTPEECTWGNQDYIRNASVIIEAEKIEDELIKSTEKNVLDRFILARLTFVIRGTNLSIGDTIIVVQKHAANGNESWIDYPAHSQYPALFSKCSTGLTCGTMFLKELDSRVNVIDNLGNKKIFELYGNKFGFATVLFRDDTSSDLPNEVNALFNLTFETKKDWYKYLAQFPDIRIPNGN